MGLSVLYTWGFYRVLPLFQSLPSRILAGVALVVTPLGLIPVLSLDRLPPSCAPPCLLWEGYKQLVFS